MSAPSINMNENIVVSCLKSGHIALALETMSDPDFDVNFKDARGFALLHYAAAYNVRDAVTKLIALGCDVGAVDYQGRTAAAIAFEVADDPALGRYLYDVEYRQRAAGAGEVS